MSSRNIASFLQILNSGAQGAMEGFQQGRQINEQNRQIARQQQQDRNAEIDRYLTQRNQQLQLAMQAGDREGALAAQSDIERLQGTGVRTNLNPWFDRAEAEQRRKAAEQQAEQEAGQFKQANDMLETFLRTKQYGAANNLAQSNNSLRSLYGIGGDRQGPSPLAFAPPPEVPKPQGPIILSEGQIAKDPITGKTIAQGLPKTFAPPKAPDPQVVEEREEKRRERMEANLRKRAEALIPKVIPSQYVDPMDYEQAVANRNAAVETVYNGLLHQAQTKGQTPRKNPPAQPKKPSLVETLKAGGLL